MQRELLSFLITVILTSLAFTSVASAEKSRGKSGAMSMDLGYGIVVNKGSTLMREWRIVNDEELPVRIVHFEASCLSWMTDGSTMSTSK